MNNGGVMLTADLPNLKYLTRGKVRDMFDLGDSLLIVVTDRLSAFDVVLPNGIPDKGRVLTMLSAFWFDFLAKSVNHHMITVDVGRMPEPVRRHAAILAGRAMQVKKAKPFPVECVVRGYLAGSGWKDYRATGKVCGIALPNGMKESERFPEPIFTPATKATSGHDENISFERMADIVGRKTAETLRDTSIAIYAAAAEHARSRGIILCDTKFEFGEQNGEIILIDEALTPDSSRFWPADGYHPGGSQPSFDKQYVRDYLESIKWNKTPPAPELPDEVVRKTSERYREAYRLITGSSL